MSATDELRRLLDGRGVEWEACRVPTLRSELAATFWHDRDGNPCSAVEGADDVPDGMLSVQACLTSEQAVEATLGRGECEVVSVFRHDYEGGYAGTEYEHVLSCGHKTWWGSDDSPDYCPWCGKKVRA